MIATASGDTSDYHADRADIVHYNKQMDVDQVNNQLIGENSKAMLGQQTYFRNQQSQRLSTYWLDQQTVIRASRAACQADHPGQVSKPVTWLNWSKRPNRLVMLSSPVPANRFVRL